MQIPQKIQTNHQKHREKYIRKIKNPEYLEKLVETRYKLSIKYINDISSYKKGTLIYNADISNKRNALIKDSMIKCPLGFTAVEPSEYEKNKVLTNDHLIGMTPQVGIFGNNNIGHKIESVEDYIDLMLCFNITIKCSSKLNSENDFKKVDKDNYESHIFWFRKYIKYGIYKLIHDKSGEIFGIEDVWYIWYLNNKHTIEKYLNEYWISEINSYIYNRFNISNNQLECYEEIEEYLV